MKRTRPVDLHETANRSSSFTSYMPKAFMDMWRALTPQSIVAVHTSSPTDFGRSNKRRAVARKDISTMPGHYPESSPSPAERSVRAWPTTPTPSPPLPVDSPSDFRAQTPSTLWSRLSSWLGASQNVTASTARPTIEASNAAALVAPGVPAEDHRVEPPRQVARYRSIIERLEAIRALEASGKAAPAEARQSYSVHTPTRDTQHKSSIPRTNLTGRRSFVPSQNSGLRESTSTRRDQDVDGLIQRFKTVTYETSEEVRFREERRLRKRRLADENGPRARAQARAEEERRVLEEERAQEEQKVQERLRAEREAELKAQEEQQALEAAQAAEKAEEEARKKLLIRPLEPKWDAIVKDAMSTTNAHKVFSKSPDGSDITRYVLGRILPQKCEGEVIARNGGKQGNSAWLNDECVDNWIAMIVARRLEEEGYVKGSNNTPSIAAYLSAFWKTYLDRGVGALSGWSKRKRIKGKKLLGVEKVFFPINNGSHWILLVISPKSRTIEVLDSLGGQPSPYFKFALEWLAMELGADYNPDEWERSPAKSSLQLNYDDCGVFTCVNALASAKNMAAADVVSVDGMKDARRMMVAVLLNGGFKGDWEL